MTIYTEKTIKRVPAVGVSALSQLVIDVDKDWGGYKIKNLGAPVSPNDALRKTELDTHKTVSPIDHPDGSITTAKIASRAVTRDKLEYPTVDVSFAYLASINKVRYGRLSDNTAIYYHYGGPLVLAYDSFTDKGVLVFMNTRGDHQAVARYQNYGNYYCVTTALGESNFDHQVMRIRYNTDRLLAWESVDLSDKIPYAFLLTISGSSIKSLRYSADTTLDPTSLPTPAGSTGTGTDTLFASGYFGYSMVKPSLEAVADCAMAFLKAPASELPPAQAVVEVEDDGIMPKLSKNLVEISSLTGLPDFLYQDARRYNILKSKGFTEDEMKLFFGYVPQHQVDLDAVTGGVFEPHPDKAPTVIITITGDNPYKAGAIERQKTKAKRVFSVPKDYSEAVSLYNQLKKDYPHWLAGKDNFVYQCLGLEVFDYFQNVDFYYGELLEHKTHYQQLKQVNPNEIENRLNELISKINTVTVLTEERDKHIGKAKEILKKGW